jgi:PAS domain S-box-containing protein
VTEPTTRPTTDQQLARLSRVAEEIRAQLAAYRSTLGAAASGFPPGAIEGLRQMSGTLLAIRSTMEEIEQERRNLRALAEIGQVVNSSLDLTTVLHEVMDTIIRLTGAQRGFLMLRRDEGDLETVVARNWERASLSPSEQEISRTIVQRVVSLGEAVLTTNAQADPRFDQQASIVAYNLRSILCIPLKVKGEITGVIYADNRIREGLFSERERSLLSAFANQAAVAVENARLFASVRRTLDEVTELKNLMENVFDSIGSGVITADVGDLITLVNKAIEGILAIPQEELLGASLQALLPRLSPEFPARVEEVKQEDRRHIGLEAHADLPGRGEVDLSLNITPLKDAGQITRGVAIVVDDLTEKRRLEAQRRLFERMVAPAVIEQLDPDSLQLGGDRAEITTLFADLRGFTSFGETQNPETLVAVLNRYLSLAAEAILHEEGTIDKFIGDAVMAWFNAPVAQVDHALRAVRAALAIRDSVPGLHAGLDPSFRLGYGVGIHTGEAILGLVGTARHINYTAIGDSVNTAKRLQENAAPGQILISRSTADRLQGAMAIRLVPAMELEGKERPVEVFEVVGVA